ncbi:MAG TPA: Hsp20/alpha crystallin family protein [Bryobacteraceae bacterium]|nr:Hsp20/alpha crystallin family protein [Bryobacteraceae bacterium]
MRQTLDHFRRTVDQLFDNFYGSGSRPVNGNTGSDSGYAFTPVIESGWNENELLLRAIVPGVTQDSLKVTAQSNQLILEGERKAPEGWTAGAYPQIAYGKFYAAVPLPQNLNVDQVKCQLHDGVLDIHVPVAEEMKPRQIPIESAREQKAIAATA